LKKTVLGLHLNESKSIMLNTYNTGLQECDCGLTLNFNNPSGVLPRKDEYFLTFTTESSLPIGTNQVSLEPSSYIITGSNNFIPKIIAKVRSTHRGETQSLIKLSIKDRYDQSLYTDYVKLICSPVSTIIVKGSIIGGNNTVLGPNGFSTMSVSTAQELDVGMQVTGPGIDETTGPVYIYTILSENSIELSQVIPSASSALFNYTFTRTTSCIDPSSRIRQLQSQNLILDKNNNWTYVSNDRFIIKFIRENPNDDNIMIVVPSVNRTVLTDIKNDSIPNVSSIKVIGRVSNDQYCIT
jgi:hypothetical protein